MGTGKAASRPSLARTSPGDGRRPHLLRPRPGQPGGLHPGRGHPGGGPGDGQEGPLPGQHGGQLVPQGPRGGSDGVLEGVGGDLGAVAEEVGRVLGAGETPEAGRQGPRRARPPGVAGQQARGRERQHHRRRPEAEENSKLFGEPSSLDFL